MPAPSPSPEDLTRQATFDRLFESYDGSTLSLPDLAAKTSWWETYWNRAREWLNSLIPEVHVDPRFKGIMMVILGLMPYVVGAIFIGAVIFAIVIVARRATADRKGQARPAPIASRPGLETQLQAAIATGDFRLAARLRWKLFLHRRREPAHRTPGEYLSKDRDFVLTQYQLMFGSAASPKPTYEEIQKTLTAMEHGPTENDSPPRGATTP
jgi:hypothetical protein